MKEITAQQIIDYIKAQSPKRKVNMHEAVSSAKCGCVMVHYAKDKIGGLVDRSFACGFSSFVPVTKRGILYLEKSITKIIPFDQWDRIRTYGDIQKFLKTKVE
jgi:hypothetical protein